MSVDSEDLGVVVDVGDLIVGGGRYERWCVVHWIGLSYSALEVHWCMDRPSDLCH